MIKPTAQMEKLLHYYRHADNPQAMADKVIASIATLGRKWVGHPLNGKEENRSTFVFKRSGGMFSTEVTKT